MCSGVHRQAHHPAPLGDLTVAGEAELLEQGLGTSMEIRTPLRSPPPAPRMAASAPETAARATPLHRCRFAGEDATDAPVRQGHELPGVSTRVRDVGQLGRRAVLAPTD